jgi:hypothetical protein
MKTGRKMRTKVEPVRSTRLHATLSGGKDNGGASIDPRLNIECQLCLKWVAPSESRGRDGG